MFYLFSYFTYLHILSCRYCIAYEAMLFLSTARFYLLGFCMHVNNCVSLKPAFLLELSSSHSPGVLH